MQIRPEHERLFLITASLIAAFLAGMAAAELLLSWRLSHTTPFTLGPDIRPKICTVTVNGVTDGNITGTLAGSGRVFIGDMQALPGRDGSFSVPAAAFLMQKIHVTIPQGTQFVASKKGTKFYPLQSASAQKIAPENRVYFRSRADAQAAGFHS